MVIWVPGTADVGKKLVIAAAVTCAWTAPWIPSWWLKIWGVSARAPRRVKRLTTLLRESDTLSFLDMGNPNIGEKLSTNTYYHKPK
jgi:hypothetical protein